MNEIKHYGMPRRSGRYPWGSGEDPYQRTQDFRSHVLELRKQGMSDVDIAKGMGIKTTQLRARMSIANAEKRKSDVAEALRLKEKGYSNVAIGEKMGINESSVRSLLDPALQERSEITAATAQMLKDNVDSKKYLDIGAGVENHLGISKTKLNTAVAMLEEEGYKTQFIKVEQVGVPGNFTYIKVLTKDDVPYTELYENQDKIRTVTDYSEDGGRTFLGLEPIRSVDSKRIQIQYGDEGGSDKDGVIELRPGVEDLSLGNSRYAQVRIGVDGTHYLKGMAMYTDDLPDGVDIRYNTNKPKGTPPEKVFKTMEDDPDNPFGSIVRQKHYIDSKGEKQLSALNIVGSKEGAGEEGAWDEWSRTLSSQVLSKQPTSLAKRQLGLAYDIKQEEFDDIMALTNPAVKKRLLMSFADDCDSSAVHLKAAALPRQRNHVLLPIPSMKETEVYAPNYRDGERVVLIRHPHGGKFEIPELVVNNRQPIAKKLLGNAKDAVGINPKVAERLSGADFDGDTVLVIPNSPKVGIRTSAPLKGLKNFDPKAHYKIDANDKTTPRMKKESKGRYMGDISNLITDMTIKGATDSEIARAVRHSMVVIDAEKHGLDYKKSYVDHGIASLKQKYQGGSRAGASTLVSKASSDARVDARKQQYKIDPKTGKKVYEYTGETYTDKTGKVVKRQIKSTKMAETDDAFTLSSGTPIEAVYATHANKLKALGNQARKEALNTKPITYSPSAKKTYAKEVARLDAALNAALKNAPLERQAQLLATQVVNAKKKDNPNMDKDDIKKIKSQALTEARNRTGAGKQRIVISSKEWEAIQAGAISNNKLTKILNNTDLDTIKQLATPRTSKSITPAKAARAKSMLAAGYTQAEVADAIGVSVSTISNL